MPETKPEEEDNQIIEEPESTTKEEIEKETENETKKALNPSVVIESDAEQRASLKSPNPNAVNSKEIVVVPKTGDIANMLPFLVLLISSFSVSVIMMLNKKSVE